MAGIKRLRKVQLGPEATAGTAVAATVKWRAEGVGAEALDDIIFVPEDLGRFGGANRTTQQSQGAQFSLTETPLTFEHFPYFCQMGVEAQQTGVADSSAYVYTFDFALESVNTLKSFTFELGNNEECADVEYCFCPEFSVRGEWDRTCMMAGMIRGRQYTAGQSFASLTAAAVDEAIFNNATLYVDAAGGTMGSTELAAACLGFDLRVTTGVMGSEYANANLYFGATEQVGWDISMDLVLRHTSGVDTEHVNWLAQTARLLELKLEGPAMAGSTYTKKTIRFQLPGKWLKFRPLEDRNGIDAYTATFQAAYDPTAAIGPKIIVANLTSSYW